MFLLVEDYLFSRMNMNKCGSRILLLEFVRKGKNIYMRNKLSSEEHDHYIKRLKGNRLKAYLELKVEIGELLI